MIIFVFGSVAAGFLASIVALLAGSSFLTALIIYSLAGVSLIALVLVRAALCHFLKKNRFFKTVDVN